MLPAIKDVVEKFEKQFKTIVKKEINDGDKELPVIWSGGQEKWDSVGPALYSSEKRAIDAWVVTAQARVAEGDDTLEWVMYPVLKEYQMTMADHRHMQRVVTNRFTVKSQFTVKGK